MKKSVLVVFLFSFLLQIFPGDEPEMHIQLGHSARITSLALSPDNSLAITGSEDHTLKLWSISAEKEMRTFSGHYEPVTSVAFSPDGKYVVSGGLDSTVRLWEISTGKNSAVMQTLSVSLKVRCAVFSPDQNYILSGGSDDVSSLFGAFGNDVDSKNGVLQLWDCKDTSIGYRKPGQPLLSFSGDFYEIYNISFSADGNYALSTGGNGYSIKKLFSVPNLSEKMAENIGKQRKSEIILWDINNGKRVCTFYNPLQYNNKSIGSYEGAYSLTAFGDNTIKVINKKLNKEICIIKGHAEYVEDCAKTGDNKFVLCGENNILIKREAGTNKEVARFTGHLLPGISDICFSQQWCSVIAGDGDGFSLWELSLGKKSVSEKLGSRGKALFSTDGKYILLTGDNHSFSIIAKENEYTEKRYFTNDGTISCAVFSNHNRRILSGGNNRKTKNGEILLWDIGMDKPEKKLSGTYGHVIALASDSTGDFAVSGSIEHNPADYTSKGEIILWDIKKGTILKRFECDSYQIDGVLLSPDARYIVSSGSIFKSGGVIKIWDAESGKELKTFSEDIYSLNRIAFSPDGTLVAKATQDWSIKVFKCSGLLEVAEYHGHTDAINSVCFSSDGKYLLSAGHDKTIKLWDVAKGKEIKEFSGHSDAVTKAIISPDNAYIISGSRDTTVRVWNRKTGEYTCLVSGSKSKDWIIYTNDGYWDSSRNGGNLIAMVKGLECWNVDQFAVMNNRPDIILQRLCGSDTSLIHHYHSQYVKRLKRLGLTEETLKKEYTVPIAKIINTEQQGKLFTIRFELSDALYNLRSYNIHVNDVPLFGSLGNTISNTKGIPNGITKGKTEKITSKIELTTGENKIEVSCMNVNGAESFRTPVYASWDKHVKGDLYFIGFGVSHYKNKEFNLKYADKDVKDLADLFLRMKGTYFNNVYIKTYLNSEVTPESIKKSKKHLSKAAPDDTFVLFISGHGMHDDDAAATYYFLTYNTDLTNLAHTAADFEFIEDILQGIAPRNKLFLMDTCESGEIVETVQDKYYKESAGRGLRARTIRYEDSGDDKGILLINKRQKRPYLFEKDRFIYNDLVRRSGAIVFSSCMGGEFSYEKYDIENGFFTEALLKSLSSKGPDKDNNAIIDTEELKNYVIRMVSQETGNLQHPTVDRDNLYLKFGFPLLSAYK